MEAGPRTTLLLAIPDYEPLADELADGLDVERGQLEISRFPDGERYLRIHGEVANRNVILLEALRSRYP